jgi:hypothetical protein
MEFSKSRAFILKKAGKKVKEIVRIALLHIWRPPVIWVIYPTLLVCYLENVRNNTSPA